MRQLIRRFAKLIIPRSLHWGLVQKMARRTPRRRSYGKPSDKVLDCCIAYNQYGAYCVPLSSYRRLLSQAVLNGEVWERDTVSFIVDHCAGGDVVHAGTYFGDFLPAISRSLDANTKLWAFEPNPESYRCATITSLLNKLENVELINSGLGKGRQLAQILTRVGGESLGPTAWITDENSSPEARHKDGEFASVNITAIDDVVPSDRNVSIIHLDIEGYEPAAVDGAMQTIRRCRPILIIEVHFSDEDWLLEKLRPLGYRKTAVLYNNVVMQPSAPEQAAQN
jgi:FkbM family methyltransferase